MIIRIMVIVVHENENISCIEETIRLCHDALLDEEKLLIQCKWALFLHFLIAAQKVLKLTNFFQKSELVLSIYLTFPARRYLFLSKPLLSEIGANARN